MGKRINSSWWGTTGLPKGEPSPVPPQMSQGTPRFQERQRVLDSLRSDLDHVVDHVAALRSPDPCPIRSLIRVLYSNTTDAARFSSAVLELGKCQSIYYPRVPK